MPVIHQSPSHPDEISFALRDLIHGELSRVRVAVAYATRAGCETLIGAMRDKIGNSASAGTPKLLVTSLDFGHTEPEALSYWRDLSNSEVRIANLHRAHGSIRLAAAKTSFHPKAYLFDYPHRVGALIGSANLTRRALSVNTESAIADAMADRQAIDRLWTESWASGEPLTDVLLGEYREARHNRPVPNLDPPVTLQPLPSGIGRLFDAIEQQGLDASQFQSFWIQSGSMSSGGSQSQLELPRGANQFFGFQFSGYDLSHATIGNLTLTSGGRAWSDRTITWHGHNKMERLNLPTMTQGGYAYTDTAILFRRAGQGFEFALSPWGSDRPNAWITASANNSTLFRVGQTATSRMCGLLP